MKVLLALMACSLAANAAYFVVRARGPASSPRELRASSAASTSEALAALAVEKADTDRATAERFFNPTHTDPKTLKEQLEASGYPPNMVKAIVGALISEDSIARQHEILRDQKEIPFWQTGNHIMGNTNDPEAVRAISALRRETNDRLYAILGDTLWESAGASSANNRMYGDLSTEKVARLQRIQSDYHELQRQITPVVGTPPSAADQEKLKLLEKEKRADIEAVLTPAELFEYDLRSSQTAWQLRLSLDAFSPTEEEFRTIFPIQRALDEAKGHSGDMSGVVYLSSTNRHPELLTKLEGVLSPERLDDLKFTTDPTNAMLTRLTNRLGLPLSAAKEVASLRESSTRAATTLQRDTTLSPDERRSQLNVLAQTTHERAQTLLGPKGVEAYLQYGGSWLNSIAPSPTHRTSTPTR